MTQTRPDGLHISTDARLAQLPAEELVQEFADGLVLTALGQMNLSDDGEQTVGRALQQAGSEINPLWVALLVLDGEVSGLIEDKRRVLPLPGFLSYQANLSRKFSPEELRLPPLNPDGHYRLEIGGEAVSEGFCFAVRLDLHPRLKVAGHVRLAVSSGTIPPQRLLAAEHRLDRQALEEGLIEEAIAIGNETLSPAMTGPEQHRLIATIRGLIGR